MYDKTGRYTILLLSSRNDNGIPIVTRNEALQ